MNRSQQLNEILNRGRRKQDEPAPRPTPTPRTAPRSGTPTPRKIAAYYDTGRGGFWTQNSRGEWIPFTESSLRRLLKHEQLCHIFSKEEQTHELEKLLIDLQKTHDVAYAGSIAGYKSGLHDICGQRVLVTTGPRLIVPRDGDWNTLKTFLAELLGDNVSVLYGWLKAGLKSLYAGPPWRPGQMLAFAGPAGCGKSLAQNLITELLGGRSAKPYRYMIGDTAFNSDLLQNEHLMIEDEAASTDLRIRRHFGSQLKNMIVNETQSLHRKGRDALSVTPFWRVTISLNDEPENLAVLPPIDESLKDKITLLRAFRFTPPYDADDIPARNAWRAKLSAELPAFVAWLRGYRVPSNRVNVRYGVNAFQDDELCGALEDLSPEQRLLQLIDNLRPWGADNLPFEGTASELEEILLTKDKLGRVAKLLYFQTACGTYLSRLEHRQPGRFTSEKQPKMSRKYKILPP